MEANWGPLRQELHEAVDKILERHLRVARAGEVFVEYEGPGFESFKYQWPNGVWETFVDCHWHKVTGPSGEARVLVGRTQREVWGEMRDRYVVFRHLGRKRESMTFYPWTEFVKTKDGQFAATIPNPDRPRALLKEGDALPARFDTARVERTDQLYQPVVGGLTLRVVVPEDDVPAMIAHGYWVAELRGRIRG